MFNEFTVEVADYQEFMDSLPTGSVGLILTDQINATHFFRLIIVFNRFKLSCK